MLLEKISHEVKKGHRKSKITKKAQKGQISDIAKNRQIIPQNEAFVESSSKLFEAVLAKIKAYNNFSENFLFFDHNFVR